MLEQPIFSINEMETLKQRALFIDTTSPLPTELKAYDLRKIPFDKSYAILKLLAAHGALTFRNKRLVVDLFSKAAITYSLAPKESDFSLSTIFKIRNQEFALESLDLLILGKPSWFIKGIHLFIIDDTLSSATLSALPRTIKNQELIEFIAEAKEDGIPIQGLELLSVKQSEPLPFLKLKDRTGAFADLWMNYGEEGSYIYESSTKRNAACEKQWESDLLETDFIKKIVGSTSYFCPLDKVTKALSFLLEIGWTVIDCQGKTVVRETGHALTADLQNNHILVSGEIQYASFKADVQNVAGAFVRRERFFSLDDHTVGLISENPAFADFAENGEIITEGIVLNRYTLKDLFDNELPIAFSPALNDLKTQLPLPSTSSKFRGTLRPYQEKGMEWLFNLYQLGLGAILADDMGLGKTIQILAFLAQLEETKCHVIVVPTSLLFNWQAEIKKFLPHMPSLVHHGGKRLEELPPYGIILTSYATLRNDFLLFKAHPIHCLIVDEAQVMKNQETKISKILSQVPCQFRISITGTPIENHIEELFAHFHFLMPGFLTEQDRHLQEVSDQRFLKRLQKKIRPFILRRRKEEVATELPEKIEQIIYVEMSSSQRSIYDSYLSSFKKNVLCKITLEGSGKHRIAIFEALLRLRQICCHPLLVNHEEAADCGKLDILMEDIASVVAEGRKALIFSQFTSMLNLIAKELVMKNIPYVRLDGSTKDREKVVHEFQTSSEIPIFLISLKAGGVGLNLTAADYVFIYDPWWNEAVEQQAISRAHRIGQNKTVIAKRYVTVESIEEKMMKLKEAKNKLINELFSDDFTLETRFSNEDLLALFE